MRKTNAAITSIFPAVPPFNPGEENTEVVNSPVDENEQNRKLAIAQILAINSQVVHAIPGRVRLKVARLRYDQKYAQNLTVLLEAESLIASFRINSSAASLIVNYQIKEISVRKIYIYLNDILIAADQNNTEVVHRKNYDHNQTKPADNSGVPVSAVATGLALLGSSFGLPIPPIIIVGSIAVATAPVLQRAVNGIVKDHKLTIDFLDFLAILITTVQGNFLTPALMLSLIEVGENIRDRTARSSQQQNLDLLSSLRQFVWVEKNGVKLEIPLPEVQTGDVIIVYPGEQIPIDGKIITGKALLDEQKLTGESIPVYKTAGEPVFASTLVREGRVYITVEKTGNDTRAGQSIQLMQAAPVHDTRMENYANKLAEKAVLPTLLLGGTVFALTRNPARAASIMTLDLATGIRVSIPTAVLSALIYATRHGVLIRSGRALEKLAQVDTIVFDKTGTLTKGEAEVTAVESYDPDISTLEVLAIAAAAEQRLTHPVAQAIIQHAQNQGVEIPPRSQWNYQLGLGVEAIINGEKVYVGSDRFLRQQGVEMTNLNEKTDLAASKIYIASNGKLRGKIEYRDVLRAESPKVINQLLTVAKVDVHLLTGDNTKTANAVAAELGIAPSHTHAEAFPAQKAAIVQQLHDQGKTVAFVGDGINDSPALAYSDVSVSFGNSSEIARETADLVLMENNLSGLLTAIKIAHQTKQLIYQNTGLVAIPNIAALAIAVLFGLNPLLATIINNGSTVVAGVNGLRPILKPTKRLPSTTTLTK